MLLSPRLHRHRMQLQSAETPSAGPAQSSTACRRTLLHQAISLTALTPPWIQGAVQPLLGHCRPDHELHQQL
eukprot:5530277-Alexandrium_andersonii.AAC.1